MKKYFKQFMHNSPHLDNLDAFVFMDQLEDVGGIYKIKDATADTDLYVPIIGQSYAKFDGTAHVAFTDLTGITITSSLGTSTPSKNGNNIEFTSGTCYNLTLSNGTIILFCVGGGVTVYDITVNAMHGTVTTPPGDFWQVDVAGIIEPYMYTYPGTYASVAGEEPDAGTFTFEGAGYGMISSTSALDFVPLTDTLKFECWLKCAVDDTGTIYSKGALPDAGDRTLQFYISNNTLYWIVGSLTGYAEDTFVDGDWHFLEVYIPASATGLWCKVDTVLQDMSNPAGNIGVSYDAGNPYIGARDGGGYLLTGVLGYLKIDINSGTDVAVWDITDQSGTTMADAENSNDMTLYSTDDGDWGFTEDLSNAAMLARWGTGESVAYIPGRNDGSGLDAAGDAMTMTEAQMPYYLMFPDTATFAHMDRSSTTIWENTARDEDGTYLSGTPRAWQLADFLNLDTWAKASYDRIAYAKYFEGYLASFMLYDARLGDNANMTTTDYAETT